MFVLRVICYAPTDHSPAVNPFEELKEQIVKAKSLAITDMYRDSLNLVRKCDLPVLEFSLFEDELYLHILLNYLSKRSFPLFGIMDVKKLFGRC